MEKGEEKEVGNNRNSWGGHRQLGLGDKNHLRFGRGFWGGSVPPQSQTFGSVGGWKVQMRRTVQQTF